MKIPRQGQFHPLKFLEGIARGLHIYEHTRVLELSGNTAVTDRGDIRGEKIIVATHFPFLNRYGAYFLKMYQQRSYVLALEEAAQVEGMYIEAEPGGLSFRNYGNLLLLGGGGHRTGKAGGGWEYLRQKVQQYYPAARECYHWAAQDCMNPGRHGLCGALFPGHRNLYVATGFHKWGMTGSMAAATLLRDMVLEKENPYARVFAPDRAHAPAPAGGERLGGNEKPSHLPHSPVPPLRLLPGVEPPGARLGVPLPRAPGSPNPAKFWITQPTKI